MSARHTALVRSRTAVVGVGSLALVVLGPLAAGTAHALTGPTGAVTEAVAAVLPQSGPVDTIATVVNTVVPGTMPTPAPSPTAAPTPTPTPAPTPAPTAAPTTPAVPVPVPVPAPVPGPAADPVDQRPTTGTSSAAPAAAGTASTPTESASGTGGSVSSLPVGTFGALTPRGADSAASPLLPGLAAPLAAAGPELAPALPSVAATPSTADLTLAAQPSLPSPASLPGLIVVLATVTVGSAAAAHVGILQSRGAARAQS